MTRFARLFLLLIAPLLALLLIYLGWRSAPTNLLGWFIVLFGLAFLIGGALDLARLIQRLTLPAASTTPATN